MNNTDFAGSMECLPTVKSTGPHHNPQYKKKMCKNWERSGMCPYYHKCQFAHGDAELQRWKKYRNRVLKQSLKNDTRRNRSKQRKAKRASPPLPLAIKPVLAPLVGTLSQPPSPTGSIASSVASSCLVSTSSWRSMPASFIEPAQPAQSSSLASTSSWRSMPASFVEPLPRSQSSCLVSASSWRSIPTSEPVLSLDLDSEFDWDMVSPVNSPTPSVSSTPSASSMPALYLPGADYADSSDMASVRSENSFAASRYFRKQQEERRDVRAPVDQLFGTPTFSFFTNGIPTASSAAA